MGTALEKKKKKILARRRGGTCESLRGSDFSQGKKVINGTERATELRDWGKGDVSEMFPNKTE